MTALSLFFDALEDGLPALVTVGAKGFGGELRVIGVDATRNGVDRRAGKRGGDLRSGRRRRGRGHGLLVALGALAAPGPGPLVANGSLATTAVGAATGGVVGTLVEAPDGALPAAAQSSRPAARGTMATVTVDDAGAADARHALDRPPSRSGALSGARRPLVEP